MKPAFSSLSIRGVVAVSAALAMVSAASADVKMVSRLTSHANMGTQQMPQTVTAYFKSGMMRTDMGDTSTILNVKTHKSLILNNKTKTYSQLDMLADGNKQIMKDMKMSIAGKVTPTTKTKKILGKPCRMYSADFTITFSSPMMGNTAQTMKMHLDQWTTTSVATSISASQMMQVVSGMFQSMPGLNGMDKLAKEMAKIKGFPLDSTATMNMAIKMPPGQQAPQGMPATFNFGFDNKVLSLKEGPVSDSLFKVPAGYKKSATPINPHSG